MEEKKLYYQQVVTIWEGFCTLHSQLFDIACDEYLALLASDIDKLEDLLPVKEEIISKIGELDSERNELIEKLNNTQFVSSPLNKASELLLLFDEIEAQNGIPALKNLNQLLIDIIEKIQLQNKKNQVFLNKAMISLRDLKRGFKGQKVYSTYGADGLTKTLNR
ncbi:MAG TPA: flagellar protein FlgN, partial [Bacteriovoracaceae bacterium]|nr:flagellar protein FlgN [Bacteriovoracaceae bacterium]